MTQQVGIELNNDVAAKLVALPSAVTPSELRLTLYYLAHYWDGSGDVFENGTLLGGATRALGMGMKYNEQREEDSLLQTYDWFSLGQPLDLPVDVWDQLTEAGLLDRAEVERARQENTFLPLFEALHRDEDYWHIVRPHVGYLPNHRDDVPPEGEEAVYRAPDRELGIAFVDGCKSWYGTKHWFRETVPHLRPSVDVFFQDFGHYTCFWIPMLVGLFRERFEMKAYVDRTYIWRLHDAPSAEEVEATLPDEPTDVDRETYDEVFDWFVAGAVERGDRYAAMIHEAHRAAAYAYIGLKDEAREILDGILSKAEWLPLRAYLKEARRFPTYTPEERVAL